MYKARVVRVEAVVPHPNADRLQLVQFLGNQVIVSGVKVGDLGVFFPTDGQLSEEFAVRNDLIKRKDPVTGEQVGGFFEENRRVKSLKLRGARSDGFWIPLGAFGYTGRYKDLVEGYEFDTLGKYPICNKYVTEATKNIAQKKGKTKTKRVKVFPEHVETDQLRFNVGMIPVGAEVIITEKIHGTSQRVGHVEVNVDPAWVTALKTKWNSWFGRFYRFEPNYQYQIVYGTRRTVLLGDTSGGFYGSDAFRYTATEYFTHRLSVGEIVYGEIVGYTDGGEPIMSPQDVTNLKDKKLQKKYGNKMVYAYGQKPGTSKFYCYRIAEIGLDGSIHEYPWDRVMQRCQELGIEFVPVYKRVRFDGNTDKFMELCNELVIGDSTLDNTHIREGIVVRWEKDGLWGVLKHKSFDFGILEGYLKDDESYVDTEESA